MSHKDYTLLVTRRGSKKAKLMFSLSHRVTRISLDATVKSMDLEALQILHQRLGREIQIMGTTEDEIRT